GADPSRTSPRSAGEEVGVGDTATTEDQNRNCCHCRQRGVGRARHFRSLHCLPIPCCRGAPAPTEWHSADSGPSTLKSSDEWGSTARASAPGWLPSECAGHPAPDRPTEESAMSFEPSPRGVDL